MKIEHKLSRAQSLRLLESLEQANQIAAQYLQALGRAKQLQDGFEAATHALSAQIGFVAATEDLPPSIRGYMLSPDGSALLGEVPDPQPIAPQPAAAPPAQAVDPLESLMTELPESVGARNGDA